MAISRARWSLQVPWKREPDAPSAPAAPPEPTSAPAQAAPPEPTSAPAPPAEPEAMAALAPDVAAPFLSAEPGTLASAASFAASTPDPAAPAPVPVAPEPDGVPIVQAVATGSARTGPRRGPDGRFARRSATRPEPGTHAPEPVEPPAFAHQPAPWPVSPAAFAPQPASRPASQPSTPASPGEPLAPAAVRPEPASRAEAPPSFAPEPAPGPAPAAFAAVAQAAFAVERAPAVAPVAFAPGPVPPAPAAVEVGRPVPAPGAPARHDEPGADSEPAGMLRQADTAVLDEALTGPRSIRIVLVEDLPDVVVHVRELLRSQPRFKLIQVITDGRRAVQEIQDLHPDVVLVDSLLQGRTSGRSIVEGLRESGSQVGIVALTVPEHEIEAPMARHADAVITLPLGTWDLGRGIIDAHSAATARDPSGTSRIVAVFSPKGGVGKTTIAYNLAATLAQTGLRTLLLDGSLQFGDVRRLLRADPAAPSICDLPTDFVRGSDLADSVVSDGSGVDILLAPPRPELAELINARDLEQLLGVLRRAYQAIVIDTPPVLSEPTLAFLDAADVILDVTTGEPAALEVTRIIAAMFAELGYPAAKVRYLVNRFDSLGAAPASLAAEAIGRAPDFTVGSDWHLVAASNAAGVPFVLARPDAPVSADLRRVAAAVRAFVVTKGEPAPVRRGPWHR